MMGKNDVEHSWKFCSIPKGIAPDNIFKTNWTLVNLNIKKKHIETSLSSLIMLIVSESMVYHMSDNDNENIYMTYQMTILTT